MPRLMSDDTMETQDIQGMQAFQFSGKRIEHLHSTEYTLATIAVDMTGSVGGFAAALRGAVLTGIDACKKSPRANNLLLRVILFSSSMKPNGIEELHGFKPLGEINVADYPEFRPYGSTNLYDATFSAVGATNAYAAALTKDDYLTNGIVIVITDGDDNVSSATLTMIKEEIERGAKAESIESLISILVGINANQYAHKLKEMADGVGMEFIDAGDATPGKLAKLAAFVDQSLSSVSQALGTGGPSQSIALTI